MDEDKNDEKEQEKNNKSENELEIEVVSGTGEELDISPVYDHIKLDKLTNVNKDKEIVIPKVKKEEDNKNENAEEKKEN